MDPEAGLDLLIEEGVVDEDEDGVLTYTEEYAERWGQFADWYLDIEEETFVATAAGAFDIEVDEAADRIEEHGVTREGLVVFLTLDSFLAGKLDISEVSKLADMLSTMGPPSIVPGILEAVEDDETARELVAETDQLVVTVWKRNCGPCLSMKENLEEILDGLPEDVRVIGIDGKMVESFRESYDVTAAPSTLFFENGEHRETLSGLTDVETVTETATRVYG